MSRRLRVELIYDEGCPNVDLARGAVREALRRAEIPETWHEWRRGDPETPGRFAGLASPSVLVNGRDVTGAQDAPSAAGAGMCRLYRDDRGRLSGAPPVQAILAAILKERGT